MIAASAPFLMGQARSWHSRGLCDPRAGFMHAQLPEVGWNSDISCRRGAVSLGTGIKLHTAMASRSGQANRAPRRRPTITTYQGARCWAGSDARSPEQKQPGCPLTPSEVLRSSDGDGQLCKATLTFMMCIHSLVVCQDAALIRTGGAITRRRAAYHWGLWLMDLG